jgi:hypothetical protein
MATAPEARSTRRYVVRKLSFCFAFLLVTASAPHAQEPQFYMKAHIDEACSCPLFCPCYFNAEPAGDRCNFNNVFTVEKGNYGRVKIDGLKAWLSGNLGDNFGDGKTEAVIAAFEPSATQEQVDAFMKIATKIYPVTWEKVVTTDRTPITITHSASKHVASRGDGHGHVELTLPEASASNGKTVPEIRNLKYFAAPKNTGFKLYYGTHRYSGHGYDYNYTKRNGFTIDIEIGAPPAAGKSSTPY